MSAALVIGGTGLLGRGVAAELRREGHEVTLLSRSRKELPPELSDCEALTADRSDVDALRDALADRTFEIVVDCAAYNRADAENAIEVFSGNTGHYWFIGTDFVYAADPSARFPLSERAATQLDPPYAKHKLEAEAVLTAAARKRGFPVTLLRPPHILGAGRPAGCDPAAGGRDVNLIQRLRDGAPIPLLAGGQFLIQPVWSREVGQCVHALSGNLDTRGRIYNLAGSECVTTRCYYEILADLCDGTLNIEPVDADRFAKDNPEAAHIVRHRIYDTRRLEKAGHTPSLRLRDALRDTLNGWPTP